MKYFYFILLLIIPLFFSCNKSSGEKLYKAEVICEGGCFPHSFYAVVKNDNSIGKNQEVRDKSGNSRGVFSNVVIINNLDANDRVEGKTVFFRSFIEPAISCQSSLPRAQFEIEIKYP